MSVTIRRPAGHAVLIEMPELSVDEVDLFVASLAHGFLARLYGDVHVVPLAIGYREHVEPDFRVPSSYTRCRRKHCHRKPVADMSRGRYFYAYCAEHLREYNREVRDGRVWWLGPREHSA